MIVFRHTWNVIKSATQDVEEYENQKFKISDWKFLCPTSGSWRDRGSCLFMGCSTCVAENCHSIELREIGAHSGLNVRLPMLLSRFLNKYFWTCCMPSGYFFPETSKSLRILFCFGYFCLKTFSSVIAVFLVRSFSKLLTQPILVYSSLLINTQIMNASIAASLSI